MTACAGMKLEVGTGSRRTLAMWDAVRGRMGGNKKESAPPRRASAVMHPSAAHRLRPLDMLLPRRYPN